MVSWLDVSTIPCSLWQRLQCRICALPLFESCQHWQQVASLFVVVARRLLLWNAPAAHTHHITIQLTDVAASEVVDAPVDNDQDAGLV